MVFTYIYLFVAHEVSGSPPYLQGMATQPHMATLLAEGLDTCFSV